MKNKNRCISVILSAGVFLGLQALPVGTSAQELTLEEVVVTAQRREQSLQEVPISLETLSGAELRNQGFRTMDDLAEFSPTVEIDIRRQDQDISIRGIGTTGNNLTLEQGAPTFSDGIHYGRTSMVKNAFLDLERVEILRGPQPVYFGQNATSGAFSLVSRKPGPEWEGDISVEMGNYGRRTAEGGVGGPITDTLGIRVAAKWDEMEGFLTDVITREKYPRERDMAGRVILQWAPNDRFEATFKYEASDSEGGAEPIGVCLSRDDNLRDPPEGIDALIPGQTSFDDVYELLPTPSCGDGKRPFEDGIGIAAPDAYFAIPGDIVQEDSDGTGFIDTRPVVRDLRQQFYGRDLSGYDELDLQSSYLELNYELPNGIQLTSLTGMVDYERSYNRNNSNSPFLGNMRQRDEDFGQWSQEFRVASPLGQRFEWMVGAYWQKQDLNLISDNFRGNLRRPRRLNRAWEDAEWLSAFATVTFNFMDDKASIDLGGRYTDVKKEARLLGLGALWVFEDPADASYTAEEDFMTVTSDGLTGWSVPWRTEPIPDNWRSPNAQPIGMTALSKTIRRNPGPFQDTFKGSEFDPQVTLRYRPTDNISTYAKWAQAFKSGGFDTGVGSLPDPENFEFKPEFAENWEVGAKGSFLDGRARADLTLFWMTVKDLQIATTVVDTEGVGALGSESTNAGKQRVRGAEFSIDAAVTDRLTARFAGAIMDGEMVEFEGAGCTDFEYENADSNDCISEEESIELNGDDELEGTIDRSGAEAPRTPDWKFALKLDYWVPVWDRYKGIFDTNIVFSDGYITNVEDFDLIQKAGKHVDMNLNVGFGDRDDTWSVSFWARNLFGVQEEYNADVDVEAEGIITDNLSPSNFRTYGVQFQYYYR